jgi:hypothetical protein
LYYGYAFCDVDLDWIDTAPLNSPGGFSYTADQAAKVFDACVNDILYRSAKGGLCIVPLSGGWDSRMLLGAALERFETSQIKTGSFGVPGQLDYDIGALVAKKFGLVHHAVDLSGIEVSWEGLLATAKEAPWTDVFDSHYNRYAVSQVARSEADFVLSGFFGDPTTGGHFSGVSSREAAISDFIFKQRREKSLQLASPDFDPRVVLPPLADASAVAYSELLDFGIRQAYCIAPIVTPLKRFTRWDGWVGEMSTSGATVLAPFAQQQWAAYWQRAPKEAKAAQKLYLEMMRYKFPDLAAMPSKYSLGTKTKLGNFAARVQRRIQRQIDYAFPRLNLRYRAGLNYLDFARAFRFREDYRAVLDKAVAYLEANEIVPWLDLGGLIKKHMSYEENYENAFLVLIGLALNLQTEREVTA